jgi:histidine triad (HIT) family protein
MEPEVSSTDCEFCEIVRGATPARVVWETVAMMAFFPLRPAALGHTLVIPKAHVPDFLALKEDLVGLLAVSVAHVGRALNRALQPDGMNAITSAGEAASQSVFHLHVHLVPRWEHDDIGEIWPPSQPMSSMSENTLADLVQREAAGAW